MKILIIHNCYQIPGGEDEVVHSEIKLLEQFGHRVFRSEYSNKTIQENFLPNKIRFLFKDVFWSEKNYHDIRQIIRSQKIDIAHIHNTFLVASPSVYQACADEGVPIVQTLHNYRFLCPNGLFYRNNHICEDCVKFGRQSAVKNRCWRDSYVASWIMTKAVDEYHQKNILQEKVHHFIALSEFSRQKFVQNGFPDSKISVKPNFLSSDPGAGHDKEDYGLFVGGFFSYKGVEFLVKSWNSQLKEVPLKMIGDGPLFQRIKDLGSNAPIEFLGRKSYPEVLGYLQRARFLVVPSQCYENFPRVIVEAFACGVPVIATNIGVMPEFVRDGVTGFLFEPGDPRALAQKVRQMSAEDDVALRLGQSARREFELKYTAQRGYTELMAIYQKCLETVKSGGIA